MEGAEYENRTESLRLGENVNICRIMVFQVEGLTNTTENFNNTLGITNQLRYIVTTFALLKDNLN